MRVIYLRISLKYHTVLHRIHTFAQTKTRNMPEPGKVVDAVNNPNGASSNGTKLLYMSLYQALFENHSSNFLNI